MTQQRAGWVATGDPATDRTTVREAASEIYRPEGVEIWMKASVPMLDGRTPNDLIEAGEAQRVLDLILALAEGVIF